VDSALLKRCAEDGMLVGAAAPLLGEGDPALSEREVESGNLRGCGHLVCTRCHCAVKSFPSRHWATRPTPEQLWAAYERDDFSAFLGASAPFANFRAYACSCELGGTATPLSAREHWQRLEISWRCAGHSRDDSR
jgi:hypothetical protein